MWISAISFYLPQPTAPLTQAAGNVIQVADGQREEEEMPRKFSRPVLKDSDKSRI